MDVHELPELTITKLSVGPMDNNAYLLRCRATGEQVLIDAANEPQRLLDLVGDGGLARVVTTHRHADHWQGLAAVLAATGARAVAHPDDAAELPVQVTEPVVEGDGRAVGDGLPGPVTHRLSSLYAAAVRNQLPAYTDWCTPVYRFHHGVGD